MGRVLDNGSLKQQIGSFAKTCDGVLIVSDITQAATVRTALIADGVRTHLKKPDTIRGRHVDLPPSSLIVFFGIDIRQCWTLIAAVRRDTLKPIIAAIGAGVENDRIVSLELGADDVSPMLSVSETLAKIRSTLRRHELYARAEPTQVVFGGFQLDFERRCLLAPNNRPVQLTGREFEVLKVFAARPNRVVSRDQVLDLVGDNGVSMDRAIDTCITRLRKKLKNAGADDEIIRTVRGAGYQLVK